MRIIDEHVALYQSFVEEQERQLMNAPADKEGKVIMELHLTRHAYDALCNLKEFLDNKRS